MKQSLRFKINLFLSFLKLDSNLIQFLFKDSRNILGSSYNFDPLKINVNTSKTENL